MNNDYKIQGDETIIYFKRSNGEEFEILIDTVDLDTVKSFPNTWCVINSRGKYIVRGTITEEKKKRQIPLKQYILKETLKDKKVIVYNINGNDLDNRRCNLATNYEPEKLKRQNEYEVKGDIAILH